MIAITITVPVTIVMTITIVIQIIAVCGAPANPSFSLLLSVFDTFVLVVVVTLIIIVSIFTMCAALAKRAAPARACARLLHKKAHASALLHENIFARSKTHLFSQIIDHRA